jgi:hypothetical protein
MKWRSVGRAAVIMLAAAEMALAACAPAMSQEPKPPKPPTPQAPAQESARSAPPDTTHYVRPLIPEDRMTTPLPKTRRPERSLAPH